MGGVVSTVHGVNTIVLWPVAIVKDFQNKDTMPKAVAGAVVGVGAGYYLFGNPVPVVERLATGDFVTGAFYYGTVGTGYWAASSLYDELSKK